MALTMKPLEKLEPMPQRTFKSWCNKLYTFLEQDVDSYMFLEGGIYDKWTSLSEARSRKRLPSVHPNDPQLGKIKRQYKADETLDEEDCKNDIDRLLLKRNGQLSKFIGLITDLIGEVEGQDIYDSCTSMDSIIYYLSGVYVMQGSEVQTDSQRHHLREQTPTKPNKAAPIDDLLDVKLEVPDDLQNTSSSEQVFGEVTRIYLMNSTENDTSANRSSAENRSTENSNAENKWTDNSNIENYDQEDPFYDPYYPWCPSSTSSKDGRAATREEAMKKFMREGKGIFDTLEPRFKKMAEDRNKQITDKDDYLKMRRMVDDKIIEWIFDNFPNLDELGPREKEFKAIQNTLSALYPGVYAAGDPPFVNEIKVPRLACYPHAISSKFKRIAVQRGLLTKPKRKGPEGPTKKTRRDYDAEPAECQVQMEQ